MIGNVLDYMEHSAKMYPDKPAFCDSENEISFSELNKLSRSIGTYIAHKVNTINHPIVVICNRKAEDVAMFLGVTYSGNFYVPISDDTPEERLSVMINSIKPVAIVIENTKRLENICCNDTAIISIKSAKSQKPDNETLDSIRAKILDTDPLFAIFTSGSTGVPKCIVKSHRSIIAFIEKFTELFEINDETIFGNQTPFYFDASTKDIFSTLKCCSTTYIIPKKAFSFPTELIAFLNNNKINTVIWVPSVLGIVANLKVLDYELPKYLKTVMFVGEVMPVKYLNIWINHLPDVKYVNLYGTTEAAGNCLYYIVDRKFEDTQTLPIGRPFPNVDVFLLDENNKMSDTGEICIRGSSIALGYYNELNAENKFCQNPLNCQYFDRICRTGDIAKTNENGLFEFVSRTDFQIKHMGNRIELGDIEISALNVSGVKACCCVYNKNKDQIVLFFVSDHIKKNDLKNILKNKLPQYMLPNKYIKTDELPLNPNGKCDRRKLLESIL